jgi:hypothetical protein
MNKEMLCQEFCDRVSIHEVPIGYVLKTPFVMPDGDPIAIYARRNGRNPDMFRLEDSGLMMGELEAAGFDLESEARLDTLGELLEDHNAQFDEDECLFHTDYMRSDELLRASFGFCQLLVRLPDLALTVSERTRRSFFEDLLRIVETQFEGYTIQIRKPLRADMNDYQVDIIVRADDGRVLAIYAATSEIKALESLLFWKECQDRGVEHLRSMLVLERANPGYIKKRTLSRVMNSQILLASLDGEEIAVRHKMSMTLDDARH